MAAFTVYVTRGIWDDALRLLEPLGTVQMWEEQRPVPREELLTRVADADALLCMDENRIDRAVMDAGKRLKVISTATAGVDHIDLLAAEARGITVCHAPGAADEAVADLTMALLLACARHTVEADRLVKDGEWRYWYPELLLGSDVQGSTIGILGLGNIGLKVAHRASGFGMRVLYYDARRNLDAEQLLGVQFGSLENVLREADFVTVHLPLVPGTRGLLGEREFRLMKRTAYLINVGRGGIVEHSALVRALRDGEIAGAGLDVFGQEPLPADDPLLQLSNVVLSPHIGANTPEGIGTMFRMAAEQVVQVLRGQRPSHPVVLPRRRAA